MAKLLLVSSDSQSCHLLQQALEQDGYDVVTTHRGDEGLLAAISALPDLILIDMAMAGVNGWQMIEILKTAKATKHCPVIAMADSAIGGPQLLRAGFDTYVRKPLSFRHLCQRIKLLLTILSTEAELRPHRSPPGTPSKLQEIFPSQPQAGTPRVVYVDDAPTQDQPGVEMIQRAGYGCVRISDSLQDLSQLLELQPQLIFIDLAMPIINSYELCKQIRRLPEFAVTPLVIVLDNDNIVDRVRARIAGASGFIHRPVQAQEVLQVLIKYLYRFSMGL